MGTCGPKFVMCGLSLFLVQTSVSEHRDSVKVEYLPNMISHKGVFQGDDGSQMNIVRIQKDAEK